MQNFSWIPNIGYEYWIKHQYYILHFPNFTFSKCYIFQNCLHCGKQKEVCSDTVLEARKTEDVLNLHLEISAFLLTWVPKQATIMWVRSLAANMAHLVQKRWEIIAKVKPTQKKKKKRRKQKKLNLKLRQINCAKNNNVGSLEGADH